MKYSIIVFANGEVGLKFLEKLLDFHKKERLIIKAVVVCENKKNPYYIEGKHDIVAEYACKNNIPVLTEPDKLISLNQRYSLGLSLCNFQKHRDTQCRQWHSARRCR